MSSGFQVFDVKPCADLTGYTLQGAFGELRAASLLPALADEGFKATYLSSRNVLVASREGVTLIVHDSGEFSVSRVTDPADGLQLLQQIMESVRKTRGGLSDG